MPTQKQKQRQRRHERYSQGSQVPSPIIAPVLSVSAPFVSDRVPVPTSRQGPITRRQARLLADVTHVTSVTQVDPSHLRKSTPKKPSSTSTTTPKYARAKTSIPQQQISTVEDVARARLHSHVRMRELKRKSFQQRVVSNLMRTTKLRKGVHLRYLDKVHIQSLVGEALRIKNKLFGKVVQQLRPLSNILLPLAANCHVQKTLTPTNFIAIVGGEWKHTSFTERYFHDEMYHPASAIPLAVDESGRCFQYVQGELIEEEETSEILREGTDDDQNVQQSPKFKYTWKCTSKCNVRKISCRFLRRFLISYQKKKTFTSKIKLIHQMDQCPIRTFSGKKGHSLACLKDGVCPSTLHHIRMLASHHTVIRTVVKALYKARNPIRLLQDLNSCLVSGTISELETLLLDIRQIHFTTESEAVVPTAGEGLETNVLSAHYLLTTFGPQMAKFDAEATDLPRSTCVDCRRMCYKANVKMVALEDKVDGNTNSVWTQLALYLIMEGKFDVNQMVTVCTYCLKFLNQNAMPARSVLNQMDVADIPPALQNLNVFELTAIQTLHAFQVVVRLQTKAGKFFAKELTKGLKGKVVYLPLDLTENIASLGLEGQPLESLLVLVNGVATRDKKIWQQLVDTGKLRTALQYLKENNLFYTDININKLLEDNTIPGLDTEARGQFQPVTDTQREEIYTHFTIYSINPQEEPGDNLQLFQMRKAKAAPVSLYEKSVEARCFPNLFPTGKGGRLDDRQIRISASEYRTSRLFCEDRRFATNSEYIFHLFFESEFSAVCQAIRHTLKTGTRFSNLTAQNIVQNIQQQSEVLESSITSIFSTVRATQQYWSRRHSELSCMLRYLGPPTWFLTLSCAEFSWEDLTSFIREIHKDVPGIQNMSAAQVCGLDPVIVCRFFDQRFKAMLHFLCDKKNGPLGLVENYFYRKEYQARGAPHVHMLLWIKDAPVFGENTDQEILDFIQTYATCEIPSEQTNPHLREIVNKYQRHSCRSYCRRKYVRKGIHYTKCRFGFPRPVTATGKVNSLMSAVRHSVKRKSPKNTYCLKRTLDSQYINDYNPAISKNWGGNVDLQYVPDNAVAVARYVAGYCTKPEKTEAQEVWTDLAADKSMAQRLTSYGALLLQKRECGIYEAIDLSVGSPLYGKSIMVLWLSIGPAHARKRVLKAFVELEHLAEMMPDSTDILKDNLLDTYYPKRSLTLEDMCLYDVAANFTFRNVAADESKGRYAMIEGNGCLVRHKKSSLINHMQLSTDTEEAREIYFFCLLQLFKPWRAEEELLCGQLSYEQAFLTLQQDIASPAMERFLTVLQQEAKLQERLDKELAKDTPDSQQTPDSQYQHPLGSPSLLTEAHFAMGEVEGAMQQAAAKSINLQSTVEELNPGQKDIYDQLVSQINLQIQHDLGQCTCNGSHQLLRFVSGEAGTGKSFLIRALQHYLLLITGSPASCVVAAPTGLAAFNVSGVTLHRLLMLPVEHDNRMEYSKLSPEGAHEVARVLRKVQLIIIDEVSMVSNLMLAYVHLRLQEVLRTPANLLFGGKHLVVFGDLLQLTPVKGQPVFQMLSAKDALKGIGSIGLVNLWEHFGYHELTQNMRQADDLAYGNMLQSIRVGHLTSDVKETLQTRMVSSLFPSGCTGPELMLKLKDARVSCVALLPTIADCNQFNTIMMKAEEQIIVHLPSLDSVVGEMVSLQLNQKVSERLKDLETSVSHTAGLDSLLTLCKNARVMLKRNLDVEQGLVNGAMGRVLAFISDEKTGSVSNVLVKFDHSQESALIGRIHAQFKLFKNVYIKRVQFPLCAAYAITIHKSQGLSLEAALIDIGPKIFKEAMAYVALSRVKRLSGLYILNWDDTSVTADPSCVMEYNRLRSLYMPHLPKYTVILPKAKKRTFAKIVQPPVSIQKPVQQERETKRVRFADEPVPQTMTPEINISGFSNLTAVECYANSSLQLLFQMDHLMQLLRALGGAPFLDAFVNIYQQHQLRQPPVIDAGGIRVHVALVAQQRHFIRREQQDCQEFLMAVFTALNAENVPIDTFVAISYDWTHQCVQCENSRLETVPFERFLFVPLPDQPVVDFQQLFTAADQQNDCIRCAGRMTSKLTRLNSEKYVVLVLTRYRANGIKLHTKISNFKYNQVSLARHTYTTTAIIFHEGNMTSAGHYIAWLRRGNVWVKCNDSVLTKHNRLPSQLQNAYILLLQLKS